MMERTWIKKKYLQGYRGTQKSNHSNSGKKKHNVAVPNKGTQIKKVMVLDLKRGGKKRFIPVSDYQKSD